MAADSQAFERGPRVSPRARRAWPFRRFMLASLASISYPGSAAEQLLLAPQELRTADPSFATEIYNGHFGPCRPPCRAHAESPFEISRRRKGGRGSFTVRLAPAPPRRRQRAVARAGQGAGEDFVRCSARTRPRLAAGDRRPPGDLLAIQFGADPR